MRHNLTFHWFRSILALFVLGTASLCGQDINQDLAKQAQVLANRGDYDQLLQLVDSKESLWQKSPSMAYFGDMFTLGDVLIGGTTEQIYWLGRKVIWKMLLKPSPNDYLAQQQFYFSRYSMFFEDAENITPYVDNLSDEMFAAVRHDTFLMLSEYVRQLHTTIIPGYRDKYTGGVEGRSEHMQNAIDNEMQRQARIALSLLATDHVNYLVNAYSHDPRDDDELKSLLDMLNVRGADRARVMRETH